MTEGWIVKTGLFKVGVLRHNIFPFAVVKKMIKIYMMLIMMMTTMMMMMMMMVNVSFEVRGLGSKGQS